MIFSAGAVCCFDNPKRRAPEKCPEARNAGEAPQTGPTGIWGDGDSCRVESKPTFGPPGRCRGERLPCEPFRAGFSGICG